MRETDLDLIGPGRGVHERPRGARAEAGRGSRRGTGRRRAPRPRRIRALEVGALVVCVILVAFVVKTFLVGVYFIPSGSMENTLHVGDRVVVDKLGYHLHGIHRGDVIVFNGEGSFTPDSGVAPAPVDLVGRVLRDLGRLLGAAPASERDFVKRVIGLPGDHVVCCDAQGRVTVNGVPLDEPYLYPGDAPSAVRFDIVVPPGRLWVMGTTAATPRTPAATSATRGEAPCPRTA